MTNYKIKDLLNMDLLKFLFSIFKTNKSEIRIVGGSIRDTLLERHTKDVDLATPLEPIDIIELLESNNINYDDFAIQYGSIIAYPFERKVQITSLREDINQIGIQMLSILQVGRKTPLEEILLLMQYMLIKIIVFLIIITGKQI